MNIPDMREPLLPMSLPDPQPPENTPDLQPFENPPEEAAAPPPVQSPQEQIGPYKRYLWPTLQAIKSLGDEASNEEINAAVTGLLELPDEVLTLLHKGGPKTEVNHRIAWARTKLNTIGAVTNLSRGIWKISENGLAIKSEAEVQQMVSDEDNRRATARRNKKSVALKVAAQERYSGQADLPAHLPALPKALSPQAARTRKVRMTRTARPGGSWQDQVLGHIKQLSADQFVSLCRHLFTESGFTAVDIEPAAEGHFSGHGLLGINVLVFRVMFGIYQHAINEDAVHNLRGAMIGRAEQGLLLTTSRIADAAREEASRPGAPPIELIDGQKLCDLLREKNLGARTVEVAEVQNAYFSGLATAET